MRQIACDDVLRMDVRALHEAVRKDLDVGMTPWLIAATAGTTDAGAVDPLEAIADLAAEFDVWMHVDAAYGGAFALCEEGSRRLAGLERADSLVLDPHKGFFLPCGIGVVLVRDGQKLYDAYKAKGFEVVGVSMDQDRAALEEFLATSSLPWETLHEQQGGGNPTADYYSISSLPTTILVDQQGNVVSVEARGQKLEQLLHELLGPAPAP